jgi:hypothetical protein
MPEVEDDINDEESKENVFEGRQRRHSNPVPRDLELVSSERFVHPARYSGEKVAGITGSDM